jgi:hypothetical protein
MTSLSHQPACQPASQTVEAADISSLFISSSILLLLQLLQDSGDDKDGDGDADDGSYDQSGGEGEGVGVTDLFDALSEISMNTEEFLDKEEGDQLCTTLSFSSSSFLCLGLLYALSVQFLAMHTPFHLPTLSVSVLNGIHSYCFLLISPLLFRFFLPIPSLSIPSLSHLFPSLPSRSPLASSARSVEVAVL